jgi:hypothetical protein
MLRNYLTRAIVTLACALGLGLTCAFGQTLNFGSPQPVFTAYLFKNITTDATFAALKSGPGVLHTICVNTPAATETITVYDSLTATGTKIATLTEFASTNPCLTYDANFTTGLTIVTATAAGDITVTWQ